MTVVTAITDMYSGLITISSEDLSSTLVLASLMHIFLRRVSDVDFWALLNLFTFGDF